MKCDRKPQKKKNSKSRRGEFYFKSWAKLISQSAYVCLGAISLSIRTQRSKI